jgi:cobalt/nickel transport system permease protein
VSRAHGGTATLGERARTPLTALAPEAKLVGLVAFLVTVAVTPPSRPWVLAGQAVIALAVAALALVSAGAIGRRLVIDLPLAVLAATIAFAGSGPRIGVAGVSVSRAGLQVGLALLAKATIGIVAVSAVAASTTASETVAGLRRLRLPSWLCDLTALTARQLQVLADDLARLRLAGSIRAGTRGRRGQWSAVARSLGVLFVRSVERADRLEIALAARGGPPPSTTTTPAATTTSAWLPALVPAAAALVLRLAV